VIELNRIRSIVCATTLLVSVGRVAGAQAATQTVVRTFVVDSAGAAVTHAELTVLRGLAGVVAGATTDRFGRATLRFQGEAGDYDLVVRKIGYARSDRFFSVDARDTLSLSVVVPPPIAPVLDPVKVTARADLKTRVYSIDADAIAASTRPLFTSWDIITKLRPDMAGGRALCRDPINLWVNGKRIRFVPPNEMAIYREHIERRQAVAASPTWSLPSTRFAPSTSPRCASTTASTRACPTSVGRTRCSSCSSRASSTRRAKAAT